MKPTRRLFQCLIGCLSILGSPTAAVVSAQSAEVVRVARPEQALAPDRVSAGTAWYRGQSIGVEGKGWDDTESFYDRLPARAEALVRPAVWSLSKHSAGLAIRFASDASELDVRWQLRSPNLAMPHMPATGVSGVDLYVHHAGRWRWLANGKPTAVDNEARLAANLASERRQYLLYLPLYNGISELEIGIPADAHLWLLKPPAKPPLVFWGTSITQGGCASRPGMCHTSILGRQLDYPVINLGFSGNGKMEPEVAQLIAHIDASAYIIDCLPNITANLVAERTEPLVRILREQSETPILLVEDRTYADAFLSESKQQRNASSRAALQRAFEQMTESGIRELYYLEGDRLLGADGEDTVDGSHPTDLGFMRQAEVFKAKLTEILLLHDEN